MAIGIVIGWLMATGIVIGRREAIGIVIGKANVCRHCNRLTISIVIGRQ